MLLFTILLWAWVWSPGSAFIIIYTNDRKLGQWEAKRKMQPSCIQLLWIVCRKRGLLRGTEKFSSLAGLNQEITTFLRWDRVLLPEQPSAARWSRSFLALSLLQDSSPSQSCILHMLKYHVVKKVIPKTISCQGDGCPVLDYLPVLPSQHTLSHLRESVVLCRRGSLQENLQHLLSLLLLWEAVTRSQCADIR